MFRRILGLAKKTILKKRRFFGRLFFIGAFWYVSGCVNLDIPHGEYNLAKAAYQAAVENEAARYSPNLYHKAERYFKRGEQLFEERDFKKAVIYFRKARSYSERSENVARLKQFQSGGM